MTTGAVVQTFDLSTRSLRLRMHVIGLFAAFAMLLTASPLRASSGSASGINRDAFLRAIAEVETGGNSRAIGRKGERGMYQFSRTTWRQHTRRGFYDAHNPTAAYDVAVRHFEWLHDGFLRNGREPDNYLMAAAWNGGLTRTLSGRIPRATRDYAARVTNLAAIYRPIPAVAATVESPAAVAAAAPVEPIGPRFAFLPIESEESPGSTLALTSGGDSEIAFSLAPPTVEAAPVGGRTPIFQFQFFATLGD